MTQFLSLKDPNDSSSVVNLYGLMNKCLRLEGLMIQGLSLEA
jgi:hypothetical protein